MKDEKLLHEIKYWVSKEQDALKKVIEYLRLVNQRRLHLKLGYGSLFQFVVKELGYSEAAAQRRVSVLRLKERVPEVLEKGHNLSKLSLIEKLTREAGASVQDTRSLLDLTRDLSTRETENFSRQRLNLPQRKMKLQIEVDDATLDLWKRVRGRYPQKSEGEVLGEVCASLLRHESDVPAKETRQSPGTRLFGAVIRRQAMKKAGNRCEFVSANGRRCDSVHALECDHVVAWSKGGKTTASNVRVLCRNHNRFAWRS
jgi:hypothetical protein